MSTLLFITHPEVTVDADTPVTQWSLSPLGRARMSRFVATGALADVATVWSSGEHKAREAAQLIADARGLAVHTLAALGENDRSSTGYLAREQFEAAADRFFAEPDVSYRGWETARVAQQRIVAAVEQVLGAAADGDIVIVSHGAVGTLYKCFLKSVPISRTEDQRRQGNVLRVDSATRALLHDWAPLPDA